MVVKVVIGVDLVQWRNKIAALLQETSNFPHDAGPACRIVLYCLGWLALTGRERGNPCKLVKFASKLPSWVDEHRPPVSLQTLLECADEDGAANILSL